MVINYDDKHNADNIDVNDDAAGGNHIISCIMTTQKDNFESFCQQMHR